MSIIYLQSPKHVNHTIQTSMLLFMRRRW